MTKNNQQPSRTANYRYILYARKSTTSEDRQVASIDAQIDCMKEVAQEHGLKVTEVMSESGSGFKVGRKVFNQMMEKIENGEADGIIVWKLSRLSRNPDDAGKIMGMLQRSEIRHIRTIDRSWWPEDNVMMMYVEFGLTNQFSRDLSADTKRGMLKKAERGWWPLAILPLGYHHVPLKKLGEVEITTEDDRFPIIQQGLKMVASRSKTPVEAYEYVKALGLKGRRGEEIAKSVWYKMLSQPFYAGTFEFPLGSGNVHDGQHIPAITQDEYDAIQEVLGRKNKPRQRTHFFSYTGLMRCGECDCAITAEKKHKQQKNGNVHHYTYYRCTKKKGVCSQPCTNIDKLVPQLEAILESIRIPATFHEWAMEQIMLDQQKYIEDRNRGRELSRTTFDEWESKLDKLTDKYIEGKVSEEIYQRKVAEFEAGKNKAKKVLDGIDERAEERIDELDQDLDFAKKARMEFENGNDAKRREIITRLGSNFVLLDHTLDIVLKEPLERVAEIAPFIKVAAEKFEPLKNADNSRQFKDYLSTSIEMGGIPDSNRRPPLPQSGALTN